MSDAATETDTPEVLAERLVRHFEGSSLIPYQDIRGVWTIGVGCTRIGAKSVTAATPPMTEDQVEAQLRVDLAWARQAVDAYVDVPLSPTEFAALVSWTFNEGARAFHTSTLLRLLNSENRERAADQMLRWVYAGGDYIAGLHNRRVLERGVFLGLSPVPQ